MSMIVGFAAVSDETIERLLTFPPLIWKVIAPNDPGPWNEAMKAINPSFVGRLLGRKTVHIPELPSETPLSFDLDKAWHGIHYLLTGTAWEGTPPLDFIVQGGKSVGDVDVGYGPVRAFAASEVSEILAAVSGLTEEQLRSRFDPPEMKNLEIYPGIWDRDPSDDDTLGYCIDYFRAMKEFLDETVKLKRGMLVYMC